MQLVQTFQYKTNKQINQQLLILIYQKVILVFIMLFLLLSCWKWQHQQRHQQRLWASLVQLHKQPILSVRLPLLSVHQQLSERRASRCLAFQLPYRPLQWLHSVIRVRSSALSTLKRPIKRKQLAVDSFKRHSSTRSCMALQCKFICVRQWLIHETINRFLQLKSV